MRSSYFRTAASHRQTMTNYYAPQAGLYDATRWMFLYGRESLIDQIDIRPGSRVFDVGCGTGRNFEAIQRQLQDSGELIGIDCSSSMLSKAAERVHERGWRNVRLIDADYGREPTASGGADIVLFSYSLSMIPDWKLALARAHADLAPHGQIGVVDFCRPEGRSRWFSEWLAINHVNVDRPYENELRRLFPDSTHRKFSPWAGLWSFYVFVGIRGAALQEAPGTHVAMAV